MCGKYLKVIEFYTETKERQQVKMAKEEQLKLKEVADEFFFYWYMNTEKFSPKQLEIFNEQNLEYK